jgi:UDP-glucose 4-epimerase
MRVLVTGGAGYIGSHTLVELLGQGHTVCVVDNYDNGSPVALDRVRSLTNAPMQAHEADIRDTAALTAIARTLPPRRWCISPGSRRWATAWRARWTITT